MKHLIPVPSVLSEVEGWREPVPILSGGWERSLYEDKSTKTKTPCYVHDVFVNYIERGLLNFRYHSPDTHVNNCIAIIWIVSSVMVNINPLKTFIGR